MTWLQRYRIRHYLSNSLWIGPLLSIVAAVVAVHLLHSIEEALGWESTLQPATAQAVLGTMAASMFTFIVFVSSALLIAVQLASSQLTPRIIAIVFRDPITKASLIVFVFTFTLTLSVLVRIGNSVPPLTAYFAAYACLASLAMFLYLIDHVGKALRPSGALWAVASLGRQVIERVYPRRLADSPNSAPVSIPAIQGEPSSTIRSQRDGVVLAFDIPGLVSLAQRADCVIELVPQVGDFVAIGDPLFRVYQNQATLPAKLLCQSVAVGQERTLEQDPAFAFRIIVDIASKGLSPAINDPTTAVLALDQIHHLLKEVGTRCLDDERVRDQTGRLRLLYRTPDWEHYVQLAVTEIRQFGGSSIQVARRMRAMLENLILALPAERATLLRQELELLHRSAERFFTDPEDRVLAETSDSQGVGGKQGPPNGPASQEGGPLMTMDRLINILVTITLIEMMAAVGLSMTFVELAGVAKNWRLIARALVSNYVLVPAVTVGLLLLFDADPLVAAGFLILAVCPGAPYGPPFAAIAKGNVSVAVALMVILAGSSALLAPVLLHFLLPLMSGNEPLQVDAAQIVVTLLLTQLVPLCVGIAVKQWLPTLAGRLQKPAYLLSKILNLVAVGFILVVQYHLLLELRPRAFLGMIVLLVASWAAGWLLGGSDRGIRRTMTLTTALRNVGVGLVIATGSFAGTPAVTAVLVYGLFEVLGTLLLALWWGRREAASSGNAGADKVATAPIEPVNKATATG